MRTHGVILVLIWGVIECLTDIRASAAQQFPASAITVDAVMQQLSENRDLVLVDVREPQAFERLRIPGSLNIPLFAVKTKAFLKTKPVVLIDEGYRPHQLAEVCEQLTQADFEARFLFGGLNAWHMWSAKESLQGSAQRALLPLQGDVVAQKTLNKMPPRALFAEQEGGYWLVIDVSAGDDSPGSEPTPGPSQEGNAGETPALPGTLPEGELFSQALSVPFDRDHPQSFLADLESAVAHASARFEGVLVLIANQHGENDEAIAQVVRKTRIAPVFFLEGGFDAYTRFVTQQHQIRQGQPQDVTTTCKSCAR